MKIIKYFKDNCPGCENIKEYTKSQGLVFDKEINALTELSPKERKELGLMSVPTIIVMDESGAEITRILGFNPAKINYVFGLKEQL